MNTQFTPSLLAGCALAVLMPFSQAAAATSADAATAEVAFNDALEQYNESRWSVAYSRFAMLADHGHVEAARIALLMLRHGSSLYRQEWTGSQAQITQWATLAARGLARLKAESGD